MCTFYLHTRFYIPSSNNLLPIAIKAKVGKMSRVPCYCNIPQNCFRCELYIFRIHTTKHFNFRDVNYYSKFSSSRRSHFVITVYNNFKMFDAWVASGGIKFMPMK